MQLFFFLTEKMTYEIQAHWKHTALNTIGESNLYIGNQVLGENCHCIPGQHLSKEWQFVIKTSVITSM